MSVNLEVLELYDCYFPYAIIRRLAVESRKLHAIIFEIESSFINRCKWFAYFQPFTDHDYWVSYLDGFPSHVVHVLYAAFNKKYLQGNTWRLQKTHRRVTNDYQVYTQILDRRASIDYKIYVKFVSGEVEIYGFGDRLDAKCRPASVELFRKEEAKDEIMYWDLTLESSYGPVVS